jgi:hypothetical protein
MGVIAGAATGTRQSHRLTLQRVRSTDLASGHHGIYNAVVGTPGGRRAKFALNNDTGFFPAPKILIGLALSFTFRLSLRV